MRHSPNAFKDKIVQPKFQQKIFWKIKNFFENNSTYEKKKRKRYVINFNQIQVKLL